MDVMEAIRIRRSVRKYADKPIPDDVMARMRQALRLAPSACNFQPWRFVFVTDADLRARIAAVAKGQAWLAEAPVVVVGCGRPDDAYKHMGGSGSSVDIDVAIALDHLTLAAVDEGLGTCWIGAFDAPAVRKLIGAPDDVKIVAMVPLGYPASPELIGPVDEGRRKAEGDVFNHNRYRR